MALPTHTPHVFERHADGDCRICALPIGNIVHAAGILKRDVETLRTALQGILSGALIADDGRHALVMDKDLKSAKAALDETEAK